MPTVKNAIYIITAIEVVFKCADCKKQIPTPYDGSSVWTRNDIWQAGSFHEMACPECGKLNKFPAKLINAMIA